MSYRLGVLFEHPLQLMYATACFYNSSCVSASVFCVIQSSWLSMSRAPV